MIRYLIGIVLVLFIGYGLWEAIPLLSGPRLTLFSPAEWEPLRDGVVEVRGRAAHTALLTVNGALTLRDQEGNFSSMLTLPAGGSILTVVASDRFGRKVTEIRHVFVQSAGHQTTN